VVKTDTAHALPRAGVQSYFKCEIMSFWVTEEGERKAPNVGARVFGMQVRCPARV